MRVNFLYGILYCKSNFWNLTQKFDLQYSTEIEKRKENGLMQYVLIKRGFSDYQPHFSHILADFDVDKLYQSDMLEIQ